MSGGTGDRVELAKLVKGAELGRGGQGTVHEIRNERPGSWPVAYKEYSDASLATLNAPALDAMVVFIHGLDYAVGAWIGEHSSWPAKVVVHQGRTRGFLMRRIPDRFFRAVGPGNGPRKPSGFEFLLNEDKYLTKVGIVISDEQRLRLLRDLGAMLARFHSLGAVVGDLSPKNLLFGLEPEPSCFLIDCDAMRLHGRDVLPQMETPGWNVPAGEPPATQRSDAYKFGLLAARLIGGQQDGKDVSALTAVDAELGALATRSWGTPAGRPPLSEWFTPLDRAIAAAPTARRTVRRPTPTVVTANAQTAPTPSLPTVTRRAAPRTSPPPAAVRRTTTRPRPVRQAPPPPGKGRAGWFWALLATVALLYFLDEELGVDFKGMLESLSDGSASRSEGTAGGQAEALAGLLARNDGTRGGVSDAVGVVQRCENTSDVSEAQAVFERAARNRGDLVAGLEKLEVDGLPGGPAAAGRLREAWQASADADLAYARWAADMSANGCTPSSSARNDWQEAAEANVRATKAKKAFVGMWAPIAEQYGLATRSWDQL
ncbi:hypothetical protein [Streptomyces sp. 8N706]|uniref:hypothetical protein n=1 Tax=Streptomyces sp. 8N706 TaxID=3457416 RepID=UPI003FD107D4